MTKEEAIKAIGEYLDTADEAGHIFPIKFLNALDMAISALKEPTWQEKLEKEYLFESIKEDMAKLQEENERLLKEVEALKREWIPITYRPATAEELEGTEYTEGNIFTCEMPEDGETVYISIYGETLTDTFRRDGFDSYFEDWGIEHVKAWHKKPEPYEAESEE